MEKLLAGTCILPTHIKVAWEGLKEVEIAATSRDMQMVRKIIILRVLSILVFLTKFEFIWISFDSWSLGTNNNYILVPMWLPKHLCSMVCVRKCGNSSWDVNHLILKIENELYDKIPKMPVVFTGVKSATQERL